MFYRICRGVQLLLLLLLLCMALLLLGPRLFGCKTLAVKSGSMEPKLPVGSLVIIKETEPSKLQKGDIITYRISDTAMVTHRIVKMDWKALEIVTKGDANTSTDAAPVAFESVVGKCLFQVPLVGYLGLYVRTPLGIAVICGLFILLILLNALAEKDVLLPDAKATKRETINKKRMEPKA